jgi:hypothetical protein
MGKLHPGEENLHHCDNSHRWTAPPDVDQELWVSVVRDHLEEHRQTMGGPPRTDDRRPRCTPPTPFAPFAPDPSNRTRRPGDRIRRLSSADPRLRVR